MNHLLGYVTVSEHVKLTRLRFGISPQELLARAPFPMQLPELFKMTWMTRRRKMTKNNPHEFQRLGVVVVTAGQESAYAPAVSMARASEPYAPAYGSLRSGAPFSLHPRLHKPLVVLGKVSTTPGMSPKHHACKFMNMLSQGSVLE